MEEPGTRKRLHEYSSDELEAEIRRRRQRLNLPGESSSDDDSNHTVNNDGRNSDRGINSSSDESESSGSDVRSRCNESCECDSAIGGYDRVYSIDYSYHYLKDAPSLTLQAAQQRLTKIFEAVSLSSNEDTLHREFPAVDALYILMTYPVLITEGYFARTALSYFIQEGAELKIMKILCRLYKKQLRRKENRNLMKNSDWWVYKFGREPNILTDLILYGSSYGFSDDTPQLIVKEFSHQILQRHHLGSKHIPYDILVEKAVLPREQWSVDNADDDNMSHPPTIETFRQIVDVMLKVQPDLLEHVSLLYHPDEIMKMEQSMIVMEDLNTEGLVSYIFDRFDERPSGCITALDLSRDDGEFHNRLGKLEMRSEHVRIIQRVLPSLEMFRCDPDWMDPSAYRELVQAVVIASQHCFLPLKDLVLPLLPAVVNTDKTVQRRLRHVIDKYAEYGKMERLCLTGVIEEEEEDAGEDLIATKVLCRLLKLVNKDKSRIRHLGLKDLMVDNRQALYQALSLICNTRTLKHLALNNVSVLDYEDDEADTKFFVVPSYCSLEAVTLANMDTMNPWFVSLIYQLKALPNLQEITIEEKNVLALGDDALEVYTALAQLLSMNRLKRLTVHCMRLQTEEWESALAQNNSLEYLEVSNIGDDDHEAALESMADVLEHHNTTLKNFAVFEMFNNDGIPMPLQRSDHGKKVLYWTLVNHFGRGKLQDSENATIEQLLECLCEVAEDREDRLSEWEWQGDCETMKHSVLFGLLRTVPTLWRGPKIPDGGADSDDEDAVDAAYAAYGESISCIDNDDEEKEDEEECQILLVVGGGNTSVGAPDRIASGGHQTENWRDLWYQFWTLQNDEEKWGEEWLKVVNAKHGQIRREVIQLYESAANAPPSYMNSIYTCDLETQLQRKPALLLAWLTHWMPVVYEQGGLPPVMKI